MADNRDTPNKGAIYASLTTNGQRATLGLKGPAVWSTDVKKVSDLQGVDILAGNPGVDISPEGLKNAALFAQEETEKNAFKASPVTDSFDPVSADDDI